MTYVRAAGSPESLRQTLDPPTEELMVRARRANNTPGIVLNTGRSVFRPAPVSRIVSKGDPANAYA